MRPHTGLLEVVRRLAAAPEVAAIAVVGSTTTNLAEPDSDIDLFIYTDGDLRETRAGLAAELADPQQWQVVGERAFGDTDIWRLRDGGPWLGLMYWSRDWAEGQLQRVLVEHQASTGYSTAFWRSIRDAQPLYERDAWHPALQHQANQPYPEPLRANIIATNAPYLRDHVFSFRNQVAKALQRGDSVSVNHRLAAWLASYFDILFALNRVPHPGEKRQVAFAQRECRLLPRGFPAGVQWLLEPEAAGIQLLDTMDELTAGLQQLLREDHVGSS